MKDHFKKYGQDALLLAIRLVLAYGFYHPAIMKIQNPDSIAEWFGNMGIPLPTISTYLSMGTEIIGVGLLVLGLFSSYISIPLIFTMLIAITFVHFKNGYEAGDNGFEIPLYYMLMLSTLLIYGSGRISIDHLINQKQRKEKS